MHITHDPCDPRSELHQLAPSPRELNERFEGMFFDPERERADNSGPYIVTVDEFYEDPESVRAMALEKWNEAAYFRYSPPEARVVGPELAAAKHRQDGNWHATAFVTYLGDPVLNPQDGWRYNPAWLRKHIEDLLAEKIDEATWETGGDRWNGACHLIDAGWVNGTGSIHHHFKPRDLEGRGWSGLVYLSHDLPRHSGTSLWRNRGSGRCISSYGPSFSSATGDHDLAHLVEPAFNRLVLFRENVLHRAEAGTGLGPDARLTQTFFFRSKR